MNTHSFHQRRRPFATPYCFSRRMRIEVLEDRLALTTISGTAYYDANLNGVRDAGDSLGIPDQTVQMKQSNSVRAATTTSPISPLGTYNLQGSLSPIPGGVVVELTPTSEWQVTSATILHQYVESSYNVDVGASWITTGLLDHNQSPDFVVANTGSSSISIYLNDGTGSFTSTDVNVGAGPSQIAVADFNGDGMSDIVVGHANLTRLSLLINNGQGVFSAVQNLPTGGTGPRSLTVADFNGDGKTDIATLNGFSNTLAVLINNGAANPVFTARPLVTIASGGVNVASARLTANALPSLVVSNSAAHTLQVYSNSGTGIFSLTQTVNLPLVATNHIDLISSSPINLAIGDLDADGSDDVAMVSLGSIEATVIFGNGLGGLAASSLVKVVAANISEGVALGDTDGDGDLDLVLNIEAYPSILRNLGGRQIANADGLQVGAFATSTASPPASGDFNDDGVTDIALVYDFLDPLVHVHINRGIASYALNVEDSDVVTDLNFGLSFKVTSQSRLNGDYDGTHIVNRNDLKVWQANYGDRFGKGMAADGNSSGQVDGRDFLLWQRKFGSSVPTLTAIDTGEIASQTVGLSAALTANSTEDAASLLFNPSLLLSTGKLPTALPIRMPRMEILVTESIDRVHETVGWEVTRQEITSANILNAKSLSYRCVQLREYPDDASRIAIACDTAFDLTSTFSLWLID